MSNSSSGTLNTERTRPIFVVGYMHSGTTLLMNIIRRNSAVYSVGGETKFFDYLPMIREQYPDLDNEQTLRDFIPYVSNSIQMGYQLLYKEYIRPKKLTDVVSLTDQGIQRIYEAVQNHRNYGFVFRIVFDHLAMVNDKSRWLEKTPTHIYHIEEILFSIPDACFVEIVRDPRDVLASKKTRKLDIWRTDRYRPEQVPWKRYEKSFDPLWDSLSWKAAAQAGFSARRNYPENIYLVRYEDLVNQPETYTREICSFLGLDFDPNMLALDYRNPADWKNQDSRSGRISSDAVGRWKQVLKNTETSICQQISGKEMVLFGYERIPSHISTYIQLPYYYLKSGFEFCQRLYGRWRLGGTKYLRNVLTNYRKRLFKIIQVPNK